MSEKVGRPDAVQRALALPPGRPLTAIIVVASGLTWWDASLPGYSDIFFATMVVAGWFGLAVFWLLRLVVYLSQNRIWFPARGHRLRWCVIPVIVTVAATVTFLGLPLHLRLEVGETELERFAQEVISEGPRQVDKRERIGTYEVSPSSVERFGDDGMRFLIDDRLGGFVYSPNNELHRRVYFHLKGPWYEWAPRFD